MLADTPTGLLDLTNEYQKAERHEDVAAGLVASSLHDAEGKMRYPRGLYHPRALQLDRLCAQMLEQSDTVPEQEGYQVYVYLVKESRPDALLRDTGGAHSDVLVPRDRFRLLYGAFDSV